MWTYTFVFSHWNHSESDAGCSFRKAKFEIVESALYFETDPTANRCVCTICFRQYHSEQTLKRHVLERHTENPRRFQCDVCHKTFSRRHYIVTHKKMVHAID